MDPGTQAAIAGAVAAVVASSVPVVMLVVQGRQARMMKLEDWRRQDEVAQKAAAAAKTIQDSVVDAAKERQAMRGELVEIKAQGEQIHTLANSNLTEQMGLVLIATEATLAAKEALYAIKASKPVELDIEVLQKAVEEQKKSIADRKAMTEMAAEKRSTVETALAVKNGVKLDAAADKMLAAADTMVVTADKAEAVIEELKK